MYEVEFRVDGHRLQVSSHDRLMLAIKRGDLTADTRVIVEEAGQEVYVGPASGFARLAELLGIEKAPPKQPLEEPKTAVPVGPQPIKAAPEPTVSTKPKPVEPSDPPPVAPRLSQADGKTGSGALGWTLLALFVVVVVAVLILSNGRHATEAPPISAPQTQPEVEPVYPVLALSQMHDWPLTLGGEATYQMGDLQVRLSSHYQDGQDIPTIRITGLDGSQHEVVISDSMSLATVRLGVGDLDGGQRPDDLLLTNYTGGAHCCTQIKVLNQYNGQWRTLELGMWDGDGLTQIPTDIGGDAAADFVLGDNSFLYSFASYAMSAQPNQVFTLRRGQFENVSADRAYRQIHIERMTALEPDCRSGSNSACAAYVASAAKVGQMTPAWAVMLASYNPYDNWAYPTGCAMPTDGSCPDAFKVEFASFPEALQAFLGDMGYASPVYIQPANANGQPSFDCSKATDGVAARICQSPSLAAMDRGMALAYTRAMAFSSDRLALQSDQQAFLARRNQFEQDEVGLAMAYQARIAYLNGLLGRSN